MADTKALATSATTHIFSSCKLTIPTSIIFSSNLCYFLYSICKMNSANKELNWIELSFIKMLAARRWQKVKVLVLAKNNAVLAKTIWYPSSRVNKYIYIIVSRSLQVSYHPFTHSLLRLNRCCYAHDQCYNAIERSEMCGWPYSATTYITSYDTRSCTDCGELESNVTSYF